MTNRLYSVGVIGTLLLVACELPTGDCKGDLGWRVAPAQLTLAVGADTTVTAVALGCGGSRELATDVRWQTSHTAVVTVNERSGRVHAVSAGTAELIPRDARYGEGARIPVTVVAHP